MKKNTTKQTKNQHKPAVSIVLLMENKTAKCNATQIVDLLWINSKMKVAHSGSRYANKDVLMYSYKMLWMITLRYLSRIGFPLVSVM